MNAKPWTVPVSCKYGAPMGRHSPSRPPEAGMRAHVARVPFIDGCYDQGGAYWGGPANLWCAWHAPTKDADAFACYFRAPSRAAAVAYARQELGVVCRD